MKIGTKGRYGLRVLLDVAQHQDKGPVALGDIAQRQGLSQKYLWQVVNPLKAAGVLRAVRGARGGFALARPAEAVTLGDIVDILEGSLRLAPCTSNGAVCPRIATCSAGDVWREVESQFAFVLNKYNLHQMLKRQQEKEAQPGAVFDI